MLLYCKERSVPESTAESYLVVYKVLKCVPKATLISKKWLVSVFFIQCPSALFVAMLFGMSVHLCKDSFCALNSSYTLY